ncbi:MAG: hypothetical protein ACRDI0_06425 [Actinomycetota bacterium]
MQRRRSLALVLGLALATGLFVSGPVSADDDGDGGGSKNARDGQTTMQEVAEQRGDHAAPKGKATNRPEGTKSNVKLVGKLQVTKVESRVADVAYHKGFAYLARWQAGLPFELCTGGSWVVDMNNPEKPGKVGGFLKSHTNTYATEGMQAFHMNTAAFTGDILLISNEICGPGGIGGLTIWDITDPRDAVKLSEGVGDTTIGHFQDPGAIITAPHQYHSAFAWKGGGNVYAIAVDNNESGQYDVDIFDLSDPTNPVLIQETGRPDWPSLNVDAFGTNAFLHDLTTKKVDGTPVGLLSYWDGGWVNLDLSDPANPVFLGDSDYAACEPFFPAFCPPEGNAHYGEWNRSKKLFIGNDEDFSPFRQDHFITSGPNAGEYPAGEFGWTVPIATLPDNSMNGPTVFGGYACPNDRDNIPTAAETGIATGPDEELILVTQRGPVSDPNNPGDACFFSEKVETAQLLGYGGAIVANHHSGSGAGASPDAFICGSQGHIFDPQIPGTCIGHREMHLLFGYPPDYTVPYPVGDPGDVEPDVGDVGDDVAFTAHFDGWGYSHLFQSDPLNGTSTELDQYVIPEGLDEDLAIQGGTYSVHEVATDSMKGNRKLAYFAYYDGGFRVAKYGKNIGINEVGHFADIGGNDFWGVQLAGKDDKGRRLIVASDRDFGLYIFRYTGP